jgi:DNA-binding response OmpR family regulator
MPQSVLIVEDERKIRDLLRSYFEREGFSVVTTGSGAEAITMAAEVAPDLMVLDLRLPDVAGETVVTEIRRHAATPILMLTAKAGEADRIRGLELGADDYVTKPFSPREVVLRAHAILRRGASVEVVVPLSFGDGQLEIDVERRSLMVRGAPVELTPSEWGLLIALTTNTGRVYSRIELLNRVRGFEFASERAVDSHVKNLRRKVEVDSRNPRIVETVLGTGYRLGLSRDR